MDSERPFSFPAVAAPVTSILVTSAQSGEGKTATAVNLAISLAQLGGRVLLIDADMRRPSVQKYFPQGGSRLSSYLAGEGRWQDMVYQTSVSGLYVLFVRAASVQSGRTSFLRRHVGIDAGNNDGI